MNRQVFYQWDRGCRIAVQGEDILQVHFAARGDGAPAAAVEPYREDGGLYANVPDAILQYAGTAEVYLCCGESLSCAHSVPWGFLTVLPRERPSDYVHGEELKTWQALENRLRALEEKGVTADDITAALGYTPADSTDVSSMAETVGASVLYTAQEAEPAAQQQAKQNLGLSEEVWSFTLEDGSIVDKKVVLG